MVRATSRPLAGAASGSSPSHPTPARRAADLDLGATLAEFEEKLPGMAEYLDLAEPGMHTTATIDFGVVLSGQATLELDDGAKVVLNPGDTYVQNGTRHRWSNTGTVPAVLGVAIVGANHHNVG